MLCADIYEHGSKKDRFILIFFRIDRQNPKAVSEANKYFLIESCIALFVSFILNLFVITVYGHNFYGVTYEEVNKQPSTNLKFV